MSTHVRTLLDSGPPVWWLETVSQPGNSFVAVDTTPQPGHSPNKAYFTPPGIPVDPSPKLVDMYIQV